jgi:hypothetical protein
VAGQVDVLSEELSQLYDDQFIETCARWVAPYIGDLIGYRVLHGVVPEVASPRAEVANTIAYRRRKGTASVLEQLARDVTGWPARAVEFFERLVTTQYMNHPRSLAQATVDLRDHEGLAWVAQQGGGFDDLAHTGDVRRIDAAAPGTRVGTIPPSAYSVADRGGPGPALAARGARRRAAVPVRCAGCRPSAVRPSPDRVRDHPSGRAIRRTAAVGASLPAGPRGRLHGRWHAPGAAGRWRRDGRLGDG